MRPHHEFISGKAGRGACAFVLAVLLAVPLPAFANNGKGKGNGGDRGSSGDRGRSDDRGRGDERGNRGGNGNGRETSPGQNSPSRGVQAAASGIAAQDGQLSEPLAAYRGSVLVARQAIAEQNAAAIEYQTLINLSQREVTRIYPNGGYNAALEQARVTYEQTTRQAHSAQTAVETALRDVTARQSVPASTQAELHRRLGL